MSESRHTPHKDDVYLGDSVYLSKETYMEGVILLYTYNGIEVSNEIYLEPEVYRALIHNTPAMAVMQS